MKKLPEKPPDSQEKPNLLDIIDKGDPELIKMVNEYNSRYLYYDEMKYRIPDLNKRTGTWRFMKLLRMMNYESVPYPSLDLQYSTTPEISKSLHIFDQYLSGKIKVNERNIKLGNSYILNSLMEEAIASSIIEGAVTTRRAAKEMLRKGKRPSNKSEQMVMNNYRAMQYIIENKDDPLTPEFILDVHRIVTENTLEDDAVGRFRDNDDVVVADPVNGTIHHIPPVYTNIPGMVEELCRFANGDDEGSESFIHPIVKGMILHFLIGYIHPFVDGNGRCARSIFYWYVLSRGYWLFEYMPISRIILRSRKDYSLAYLHTEYDEMDLTYFILYNIRCIEKARTDLLSYIKQKQAEQSSAKKMIKNIPRLNTRQAEILREMMEKKEDLFTIREITETWGVVYETARTDLMTLADLGYIMKEKRGREFMFRFDEGSRLED